MILRPYQEKLVKRAETALKSRFNTLSIAATGAGKTIMLSALAARIGGKTLILQHRDEITDQNLSKFHKVNPKWKSSIYNGKEKDFSGDVVFSMVQTLSRHVCEMPRIDHLIIDEAHHSCAKSYLKVLHRLEELNPKLLVSGWTATPERGDKLGLMNAGFDNLAGEIGIEELVRLGYLVKPVCYAANFEDDIDLSSIRKTASGEYDMKAVDKEFNIEIKNHEVVKKWAEYAGDRKTIVFASTISHAENLCVEFSNAGFNAEVISSLTGEADRKRILDQFDNGDVQVICNVAVLTEGYDSQPVSCVVLVRPCSYKSTMIQMIGRGLRTVDPEIYPNVEKNDCIILDFGQSLITHGDLWAGSGIEDQKKYCPDCEAEISPKINPCPFCGHDFTPEMKLKRIEELDSESDVGELELVEIEILKQSPFAWVDLFDSGKVMAASGFDGSVFIASKDGIHYSAFGKAKNQKLKLLQRGNKGICLSRADDYMRETESTNAAKKTKRWIKDRPSDKQAKLLSQFRYQDISGLTKYSANCHLNFWWNKRFIEGKLK